jgi:hypothetical protein
VLFYFAHKAAGASSARHSLRPLLAEGGNSTANLARNERRDSGAVAMNKAVPLAIFVMPGLDPGIHVFLDATESKTWMAGTSPAMTEKNEKFTDSATPVGSPCPLLVLDVSQIRCSA